MKTLLILFCFGLNVAHAILPELGAGARNQQLQMSSGEFLPHWFITCPEAEQKRSLRARYGDKVYYSGETGLVLALGREQLDALLGRDFKTQLIVEAVGRAQPCLDLGREATAADDILVPFGATGEMGLSGQGVLIGVVDTGLDFEHADFRDAQGESRVLAYWDQIESRYYTRQELLTNVVPNRDDVGHGTHVTGIAAGNGRALDGQFRGFAPDADLAIVRTSYFEDDVLAAVQWLFEQAAQSNRSCVVNLSLESPIGSHDGNSFFERELSALCGPGRLVVAAAGNSAASSLHYSAQFHGLDVMQFTPQPGENSVLVSYTVAADRPDFRLVAPDGQEFSPSNLTRNVGGSRIVFPPATLRNGQWEIQLELEAATAEIWELRTEVPQSDTAVQHAWGHALTLMDPDVFNTISIPATADSILSAGSYVTRWSWESSAGFRRYAGDDLSGGPSSFSGWGPRVDGREIPNLLMPGQGIFAPQSSLLNDLQPEREHPSGFYRLLQGTSMAAPALCGTLALLLEVQPQLGPAAIEALLAGTGSAWQAASGRGLPDLVQLLDQIQGEISDLTVLADLSAIQLNWQFLRDLPNGAQNLVRLQTGHSDTLLATFNTLRGSYTFSDYGLQAGDLVNYRLEVRDSTGAVESQTTSAAVSLLQAGPELLFAEPWPNPADQSLNVEVLFAEATTVSWSLYTITGQQIRNGDWPVQSGRQQLLIQTADISAGPCILHLTGAGKKDTRLISIIHQERR